MKIILVLFSAALTAWGQSASTGSWNSQGSAATQIGGGSSGGNSGGSEGSGGTSGGGAFLQGENAYCRVGDVPNFGATNDGPALLPTACVYTDISATPSPGSTVTAGSASALTSALSSVACGQTIVIPAASTFSGTFTLPAKSCDAQHWITIVTDQTSGAGFPAPGHRISPCAIAQVAVSNYPGYTCSSPATLMPTIQSSGGSPVFKSAAGASYYRLVGLNITKPAGVSVINAFVDFSAGCDHCILDRVLIHGVPLSCSKSGNSYTCNTSDEAKFGVNVNSCTYCAVIDSWIYDLYCMNACSDANGIIGGFSAGAQGPVKIYNNLIAAAGESWGSGGGSTNLTPTDFEIRQNHSFKPPTWFLAIGGTGQHPIVKNLGEFKNADRALFEGNEFENSWQGWQSDQLGYATLFTPKNQSSFTQGTASSDGAGNLTALTGSFPNVVAAGCATPGHCKVTYNGTTYQAQSRTDSTHISVSPAPPALGSASFKACSAGLSPNAGVSNITYRFNHIRNAEEWMQVATATSDCGDVDLTGAYNFSIHDNLAEGLNGKLANNNGPTPQAACLDIVNGQPPPTVNTVTYAHNTCVVVTAGNSSNSGLAQVIDVTMTGSGTGGYFPNMVYRDNLAPAAWRQGFANASLNTGGALGGLNQTSCPNHDGLNCTWTMTHNVLGAGLWTGQTVNKPYPASNADSNDSPAGAGCNATGVTCFPSLSAWTGLFVNYSNGYGGDYHLAANSPYAGAGTDGQDIGANIDQVLLLTAGVRSPTNYIAPSITTTTLPSGTVGSAYSQQLNATSASDFQLWSIISGSLPPGLSLSRGGMISGTPTAAANSSFSLQMMDAVQHYATKALTLTIN